MLAGGPQASPPPHFEAYPFASLATRRAWQRPKAKCGLHREKLEVEPDPAKAKIVQAEAARCSSALEGAPVKLTTACFLPGSDDGLPVIGRRTRPILIHFRV